MCCRIVCVQSLQSSQKTIRAAKVSKEEDEGLFHPTDGFIVEISADAERLLLIDRFETAAGFELPENTVYEAKHLAKDYISTEYDALKRLAMEALAE